MACQVRTPLSVCRWVKDIEGSMSEGKKLDYPIVADPDRKIAQQ